MNYIRRAAQEQANSIINQRDALIISAINNHLGEGWVIEDIIGKTKCESFINNPEFGETFYLNDKPILIIYPANCDGDGLKVWFNMKYKFLGAEL